MSDIRCNRRPVMDSNGMKKLGVVIIILLLALYCVGFVVLLAAVEEIFWAAVIYSAVFFVFMAVLISVPKSSMTYCWRRWPR